MKLLEPRLGKAGGAQWGQAFGETLARAEQADIAGGGRQGGGQGLLVRLEVVGGDGDGGPGVHADGGQGGGRIVTPIGDAGKGGGASGPLGRTRVVSMPVCAPSWAMAMAVGSAPITIRRGTGSKAWTMAPSQAAGEGPHTRRRPSLTQVVGRRASSAASSSARAGSSGSTFSTKISMRAPQRSWMSGQGLPAP